MQITRERERGRSGDALQQSPLGEHVDDPGVLAGRPPPVYTEVHRPQQHHEDRDDHVGKAELLFCRIVGRGT